MAKDKLLSPGFCYILTANFLHGFAFGMVTVSGNTIVIDIQPSSRRGEGLNTIRIYYTRDSM